MTLSTASAKAPAPAYPTPVKIVFPVCSFGPLNPIGPAPLKVHFDASGSENGAGFYWYVSDKQATPTGITLDYTFYTPGVYYVRLIVISSTTGTNQCGTWVTVKEGQPSIGTNTNPGLPTLPAPPAPSNSGSTSSTKKTSSENSNCNNNNNTAPVYIVNIYGNNNNVFPAGYSPTQTVWCSWFGWNCNK